MTLKETLLNTGYFLNNEWLDAYCDLVKNNGVAKCGATEKHHILQRAYFKLIKDTCGKDAKANLVHLSFADHVRAHWFLYKCTQKELKLSNEVAVRRMVNGRVKYDLELGLTIKDYEDLQAMWLEIKNDESTEYFSEEAEAFLLAHYNTEGPAYCAKALGRSRHCITTKATKIGLREPVLTWWTDEEITWLKENKDLSLKQQAAHLNRSYQSVSSKRRLLGIAAKAEDTAWTDDELQILKDNYEQLGREGCAKLLNRPVGSVQSQASYLGLRFARSPIYCVELDKRFSSIYEAGQELNIAHTLIRRVLSGKQKQTNGYRFIKL